MFVFRMASHPVKPGTEHVTPKIAGASRALHVATLLTAILAFPLVWLGGFVTTNGAGMSVPDWPNSYGYNMFALPFDMWLDTSAGGALYEHSHRLLGTLVGLAAFTATMIAWAPSASRKWRKRWLFTTMVSTAMFLITLYTAWSLRDRQLIDPKTYQYWTHGFSGLGMLAVASAICLGSAGPREPTRWRRWVVTSVLIVISIQGLMGGLRVSEVSLLLAKLHGILGQLTFAFAAVAATACSRWWRSTTAIEGAGSGLRKLAYAALMLAVVQLALGAFMRHDPKREADASRGDASAGLSIPDWPLHYGKVLPPMNAAALEEINQHRIWDQQLPAVTMGRVWLHFAHRVGAYITAIVLLWLAVHAWRWHRNDRALWLPAVALGVLVIAQVTLGVLTVLWRKPADIATLHQATGALIIMTAAVLVARASRRYPASLGVGRSQVIDASVIRTA